MAAASTMWRTTRRWTRRSARRIAGATLARALAAVALLGASPTVASGQATWWVAGDGSDASGNGSLAAPWATISHA
jgi:hypothetical protein